MRAARSRFHLAVKIAVKVIHHYGDEVFKGVGGARGDGIQPPLAMAFRALIGTDVKPSPFNGPKSALGRSPPSIREEPLFFPVQFHDRYHRIISSDMMVMHHDLVLSDDLTVKHSIFIRAV